MRSYAESLAIAESWTKSPFDSDTIATVRALLSLPEGEKEKAILDRFGYDLGFGTAGMRALVDAGTARINEHTIRRVSAAVAQVLKSQPGSDKICVVIGYDGRRDSPKFAKIAEQSFLAAGIDVFSFDRILPTPIIPFAVRRLKAQCGVMITSSHNAAAYNGYKVYAANGAQILSPFDSDVMAAMSSLSYHPSPPDRGKGGKGGVSTILDEKLLREYTAWAVSEVDFSLREKRNLKIVFTPLHGAAGAMMNAVFYKAGFKNFMNVHQQYEPHPLFPTVKAPNPENKGSLDMARDMAVAENAELILATDGDGDRVGVAFRQGENYVELTGNQIGTLFLFYLLTKLKERGDDLSRAFALSSVVSTPLTRVICKKFGVKHFETLTGFKNMGNLADDLVRADPSAKMVLAFEEAFGVTIGDSRDKDGLVSNLLAAHIAADQPTAATMGGIETWLNRMYSECGYAAEDAVEKEFPGAEGIEQMNQLIESIRRHPPREFLGYPVTSFRDFKTRIEQRDGKEFPITEIPEQNLLHFANTNGDWLAVRPSGTEPKVKVYLGVRDESPFSPTVTQHSAARLKQLADFARGLLG